MANTVFRTAGRLVKWPLTTLIRPYPWLNARVWDLQYALGFWSYLDRSAGELPLDLIAKYADQPRILDLGCGTTVNLRLVPGRYRHYHGVDISRAAIRRARALRRPDTSFEVADVLGYRPIATYDVILLREVLYYFPLAEIPSLLHRLAAALTPDGVIIVTLYDSSPAILDTLRHSGLAMVDELPTPHGTTVVLR